MSWQAAPLPSQISHWYANVIGAVPLHVPGLAVSVFPAVLTPPVVGCAVFEGATVARVVIAAAVPTATRASAAAPASMRRLRRFGRNPGNRVMREPPEGVVFPARLHDRRRARASSYEMLTT